MGKKVKIEFKDWINWGIKIFLAITTIIFGQKYYQTKSKNIVIHNSVNKINQYIYNNNYNLPSPIVNEIKNITEASGAQVTFEGEKLTSGGEPIKVK